MAPNHPSNTPSVAQIVRAPDRPAFQHITRLFLAGTTPVKHDEDSQQVVDWRTLVCKAVCDLPVTIFDPLRPDWDSSWVEDMDCPNFHQQVDWELSMQEQSSLIAFFFDTGRDGHISLMELGLCAGRGSQQQAIVGCPPGYVKRGNVQVVCARYGIHLVDSAEALAEAVRDAVLTSEEDLKFKKTGTGPEGKRSAPRLVGSAAYKNGQQGERKRKKTEGKGR